MDDLLKGESPIRSSSLPIVRFLLAVFLSLPVLPALILATIVRDWFVGGESLSSLYGGMGIRGSEAGLVQRAVSKTAIMVTAARYVGYKEGWTNDSLARHFIPWEMAKAIDLTRSFQIGFPVSLRYSGFLMARTLAGDRLIQNTQPKQIILLGAGLDTRAHRLNLPRGCRVYEIDIANTQAMKRRVAEAHPDEFHGPVEYVPVDFSKESFVDKLKQASFDFECAETVVLFEGVSYYLPWEALKTTMEMLVQNLAPGTLVGLDAFDDMFTTPEARQRQRMEARGLVQMVKRVGEPFQWGVPVGETAASVFTKLGFDFVADVTSKDMERLFFTPRNGNKAVGKAPYFVHYVILRVKTRA